MAQKPEQFDLPDLSEVRIRSPQPPVVEALLDGLRRLVRAEPRIAFAYLPQVQYGHSSTPEGSPVLVLVPQRRLTEPEIDQAVNAIGEAAQDLVAAGEPLDVMTLPPEHELLSLVMRTGCCLEVNNVPYHAHLLRVFRRFWEMSA